MDSNISRYFLSFQSCIPFDQLYQATKGRIKSDYYLPFTVMSTHSLFSNWISDRLSVFLKRGLMAAVFGVVEFVKQIVQSRTNLKNNASSTSCIFKQTLPSSGV
jgi:hypothetical protein